MKKFILASVAAVGLFGIAACSDSTDNTTTQSTNPPATTETAPGAAPAPSTGTGGDTQMNNDSSGGTMKPMEPAPASPAPAQ